MFDHPHRRLNLLTGEWVLVSPQRSQRPWQGQVEAKRRDDLPAYDPACYLCPGNERAGGLKNLQYDGTFVFTNDFSALVPDELKDSKQSLGLFRAEPETGYCKVVCFSPRHDLSIPEMTIESVTRVIQTWAKESSTLYNIPAIKYVQVFENKGAMMGCSNPHPHSQIWSQSNIPNEIVKECRTQKQYFLKKDRLLLLDYLDQELVNKERVILGNSHFTALVPFWAEWPFETIVIAHRAVTFLSELTKAEKTSLADVYRRLTIRYDNLFKTSFPYSMGFHQAPKDGNEHPEWVLHAHFYPPLLRSATIRKFMVGYELLAMPQRDITPESAAERLRAESDTHYKFNDR
jgi:UDPglucose--hexose-1-phosphate uridylyltransferase